MPAAPDLAAVEARLDAVLAPYRVPPRAGDHLQPAHAPAPGREGPRVVRVRQAGIDARRLLPDADGHLARPARRAARPALLAARSGKSVFTFRSVDEAVLADLEALVARAYTRYAAGPGLGGPVPEFSRHPGTCPSGRRRRRAPCLSCLRDEQEGRRRGR